MKNDACSSDESPASGGSPQIVAMVAVSENNVIGRDGDLPWRQRDDLKRFKATTMGHPLIMGRKTYKSLRPPLVGRCSIVLTRDPNWLPEEEGAVAADSLEAALEIAKQADRFDRAEVFILGGGAVYRQAMPLVQRVYLTRVHAHVEGDTTFPELDAGEWKLVASESFPADDRNDHPYSFEVWERSS